MVNISIIVPIYNVEPYISRCIKSVMDQTYTGPMECLLVDDCGTDKTMSIVESMLDCYQGPIDFRVFHHDHNRGQAAARNTGTLAAKGEYVYYLDSDDAMTPDCLEYLTLEIAKYQGVEMVIGAYQKTGNSSNNCIKKCCEGNCHIENNEKIRFLYFKEGSGFDSVVWNRLIKKSFVMKNTLFFKEGVIHEDDHWCFYAYKKLNSLSIIDHCTYLHYIRTGSTMTTMTHQRTAESMLQILGDWAKSFDGFGRSLQMYKALIEFLIGVFPYIPRNKTVSLQRRFFNELVKERQFEIALYFFINRWFKWRYYKLSNELVPKAYRKESQRLFENVNN